MILGTAGHIDHGKTALVKALTGVDTDRLPEEKRRGITIDLGFASLEIEGRTIGVVDVPGHEAFIRTMLAGASGIDMAMLVIAADEGVMPQTREHLEILSLLGVTRGVVAVTKSDLVDAEWLALQDEEIRSFISSTSFDPVDVIAVSARTGNGIAALRNAIHAVAETVGPTPAEADLFRMPIDRAFSIKGTGTVVTGTVWTGEVTRDSTVIVRPGSRVVRVRGIQHHGQQAEAACAGQRTAVALVGLDVEDAARGSVLVSDDHWVATREIDATVKLNGADVSVTARTRVEFHLGTSETTARIVLLPSMESPAARDAHRARIHFTDPILVRGGDRFVLRLPSPARTIGGGVVVDSFPDSSRRRTRNSRQAVESAVDALPQTICESIIAAAGARGVVTATLPIRTGLNANGVALAVTRSGAQTIGSRVFSAASVIALASQVEEVVKQRTANHPLDEGVSLQSIRASVVGANEVVDAALSRLVDSGKIERSGSMVRPVNWQPELDSRDKAVSEGLLHDICERPSEPPSVGELVEKFGVKTVALLRKLERDKKLDRVSEDRYYSTEAVDGIIREMESKLETGRTYTPAELREVLGVSRKYLIPFLEFCDRRGVTERRPEGRVLR